MQGGVHSKAKLQKGMDVRKSDLPIACALPQ